MFRRRRRTTDDFNAEIAAAIARLAPGLTIATAQERLDRLAGELRHAFPDDYPAQSGWTLRLVPLQDRIVGDVRGPLVLLMGAVAVVLLIGCVNVVNLQLARGAARAREIAMRQVLGAGRGRLIRQLLTESVLLSVAGEGVRLTIVGAAIGLVSGLMATRMPASSMGSVLPTRPRLQRQWPRCWRSRWSRA